MKHFQRNVNQFKEEIYTRLVIVFIHNFPTL